MVFKSCTLLFVAIDTKFLKFNSLFVESPFLCTTFQLLRLAEFNNFPPQV